MPLQPFLTDVFLTELYADYRTSQVAPQLVNETAFGSVARVGQSWSLFIPRIEGDVVKDHTKGQLLEPTLATGAQTFLTADRDVYIDILIDFADEELSSADMVNVYRQYGLAELGDTTDNYIFGKILDYAPDPASDDVFADRDLTRITAAGADAAGVRAALKDAKVALSNYGVPRGGRYAVTTPDVADTLSEVMADRETTGGDSALVTGFQGQLESFSILESNNVPDDTIIFGVRDAFAFKDVLRDVRDFQAQRYYGYEVQARYIFGGKVLNPHGLGIITVPAAV